MYLPSHFEQQRPEELHGLISEVSLGMLVTLDPDGLNANHIPFDFDPEPAPYGTLRAHVARGNPVWRTFSPDVEALVVFQGPQAYVSPSWYPTKKEDGKVVPTYNYMVVHAYGAMRTIDDPAWLLALLERLTDRHESGRREPWKIDDAPTDFIEKRLSAIVGIEIAVSKLVGKWKVSQNRSEADRAGVAQGLTETGNAGACAMAQAVSGWKAID
jgi:transcriptional regulator